MIRIDFGTLYEFEREDNSRRRENRKKIQDFLSLCETHEATIVEQRDWNTRDLIHFLGISPNLVFTITISEKYLGVQTSQIREKFQTFRAEYVSVPDFQHCVRCGEKLDTMVKSCKTCNNGVLYHPSYDCCPICGGDLQPDYDSPPLNELDPHGLIWGISNKEETAEEGEDLFGGGGPLG